MKPKMKVVISGKGTVVKKRVWTCPGCEVTYDLEAGLFDDQAGAKLCKDCLRENELLCRLGNIKKSPSES